MKINKQSYTKVHKLTFESELTNRAIKRGEKIKSIKIENHSCTKIQKAGKYSLCAIMTEQLKELGIKQGDKVYCCVEVINGKKRIVVEGVK